MYRLSSQMQGRRNRGCPGGQQRPPKFLCHDKKQKLLSQMTSTGPSEHIGTWELLTLSPTKFSKFRQPCSNDLLLYFGPSKFLELPPVLKMQLPQQDVISNYFFFMDIYLAVMNFFKILFLHKNDFFSMMTILLICFLLFFKPT